MHIAINDERSKNFSYRNSDNLLLRMGPEVSITAMVGFPFITVLYCQSTAATTLTGVTFCIKQEQQLCKHGV